MPSRVIAFFLAVVLLWSGLGTIEAPHAFAAPSPEHMSAIDHADDRGVHREGSVEDHHLDDLPSQVQNDPVSESPDLLPSPSMPGTPTLPIAQLRASVNAAVASPSLAGLLRPPSSAARIG